MTVSLFSTSMKTRIRRRCTHGILHRTTLLLFILFARTLPGKPLTGTNRAGIIGRVVTAEGSTPLAHVEVFIEALRRGDVSNRKGEFHIEKLPPGKYELTFRLQGYETRKHPDIVLPPNQTVRLNVALTQDILQLEDLVVTATRSGRNSYDVPQLVSLVTPRQIHRRNVQQTPELLREEAGVALQKTNQGGGSPIIRGFKANKVLLLVDGIRMNNATYRGGNTQYLNTIGSASIEQLEIVHGPSSVLYGSDALGGTVNVLTRAPRLRFKPAFQLGASVFGSVSTAENTRTTHLRIEAANHRIGLLLEGAVQSFGDIQRGDNGGGKLMRRLQNDTRTRRILNKTQAPNAYDSYDLSSKVLWRIDELQGLTAAFQLNRQTGVPRYDVVETRRDSLRVFDPQERDLFYLTYRNDTHTAFFNSVSATLSFHRQFERRIRQRFGSATRTRDQFRTWTSGLQLQLNKQAGLRHTLVTGTEIYFDDVAATSSRRNTFTDRIENTAPLFPDGSTFLTAGLFAQDAMTVTARWNLTLGARLNVARLRAPFEDDPNSDSALGNVVQTSTSVTASLGSNFAITDEISFVSNVSQGFRVPNLDDVSKLGPGGGSSFFDIPNPEADPEKSINLDSGFKIHSKQLSAAVVGFFSSITDLLIRRPATFEGLPFVLEGSDTLAVFRKENAGKAYTTGFAANAEVLLHPRLAAFGNLSYTYGQSVSDDEPLSGIPPFMGQAGLRWHARRFWIEVHARFASEQNRLSFSDLADLRIPQGGTPGWWTLNMRSGINLWQQVEVTLSIANLLDRNYREHLSGFNAPGRNFVLSGRLTY